MEVRSVDPRTERWSDYAPIYRVYFWGHAYSSDEHQLLGAQDVREVLAWAEENCGSDRTYTVYVEAQRSGVGLIRLYGIDPTRRD